jgi:hypothetical protein
MMKMELPPKKSPKHFVDVSVGSPSTSFEKTFATKCENNPSNVNHH